MIIWKQICIQRFLAFNYHLFTAPFEKYYNAPKMLLAFNFHFFTQIRQGCDNNYNQCGINGMSHYRFPLPEALVARHRSDRMCEIWAEEQNVQKLITYAVAIGLSVINLMLKTILNKIVDLEVQSPLFLSKQTPFHFI